MPVQPAVALLAKRNQVGVVVGPELRHERIVVREAVGMVNMLGQRHDAPRLAKLTQRMVVEVRQPERSPLLRRVYLHALLPCLSHLPLRPLVWFFG